MVLVLPQGVSAQAVHTRTTVELASFFVGVPCANDGLGESVLLTGTFHVVSNPGREDHVVWSSMRGVGTVTGDQYVATAAAPGGEAFVVTYQGTGRDGIHFVIVIQFDPVNEITVHCM